MAAVLTPVAAPAEAAAAPNPAAPAVEPLSPNQRAWRRFRRNRIGAWSLWIFVAMLVVSALAEVLSNDKPLVARYDGSLYFPLFDNPPETRFGGDFRTPTDWSDPFIAAQFAQPGNWLLRPLNRHSSTSIEYFSKPPNPAPPNRAHWLGTDELGRDMVARLLYGFRVSVLFALALTAIGVAIGLAAGAVQGYFAGRRIARCDRGNRRASSPLPCARRRYLEKHATPTSKGFRAECHLGGTPSRRSAD